jgi:hypothetical protein
MADCAGWGGYASNVGFDVAISCDDGSKPVAFLVFRKVQFRRTRAVVQDDENRYVEHVDWHFGGLGNKTARLATDLQCELPPEILLTINLMRTVGERDRESTEGLGKHGVFIVGLAGASGSGKSRIAKRVASRLNGHVISMEVYSVEMNHLPLEERAKQDYDSPHAIDLTLLERHVRDYSAGKPIEAPI